MPTLPAPKRPRRQPRAELRERLARCEELLERIKNSELESPASYTTHSSTSPSPHVPNQQVSCSEPIQQTKPPTAKILIDRGAVRYTDKWLWAAMAEEVFAMKALQEPELPYDDGHLQTAFGLTNDGFQNLSLSEEEEFDDLSQLQPLPSQMYSLWQLFLERVHPLTKVIHPPSIHPYLVDAICGTSSLPKNMQALLFSIFGLAALSLSEEEAWNMLGTDKDNALRRFAMGLRMALLRAQYLERPNLTVLQALTLYLMSLQGRYDSQETWILNSICVRMAQKMGLHRDGEVLGLSPFETEMRRRVWWQIAILDVKFARASGMRISRLPPSTDCKMPTNIDDAGLDPNATEPFKDQQGPTEMIICLLFCKVGHLVLTKPEYQEALSQGEAVTFGSESDSGSEHQMDEFTNVIREIEKGLDETLEKFSYPEAGPIHEFASDVKTVLSSRISEMGQSASQQPEWGTEIITPSDNLFKLSIMSIEQSVKLHQKSKGGGFSWSILFNLHYDIFSHMVGQLSLRTSGSLVERAWNLVPVIYSIHEEFFDLSQSSSVSLANFVLRAWKMRSSVLRARLGSVPEVPDYIQRLDLGMSLRRVKPRID